MTITDQQMPHGRTISALSLAVKLKKSNKISYNMTQIASVLVVATGLQAYGLEQLHFIAKEGGEDKHTYVEILLKVQEGTNLQDTMIQCML